MPEHNSCFWRAACLQNQTTNKASTTVPTQTAKGCSRPQDTYLLTENQGTMQVQAVA
jgi:hypothetical protein